MVSASVPAPAASPQISRPGRPPRLIPVSPIALRGRLADRDRAGNLADQPLASSLRRLTEAQHEVVGLADRNVLRAVLIALRESRRQGPYAIHPVLGIFGVGV